MYILLQALAHGVLAGDLQYVKRMTAGPEKYNINFRNMVNIHFKEKNVSTMDTSWPCLFLPYPSWFAPNTINVCNFFIIQSLNLFLDFESVLVFLLLVF